MFVSYWLVQKWTKETYLYIANLIWLRDSCKYILFLLILVGFTQAVARSTFIEEL